MTDELAAIEARHVEAFVGQLAGPETQECVEDGQDWPCDASQALAALHAEQAARARVEADYDHLVEVAREAAALLKRARLEQSIRHVHVAESALRALIDPATPEPVRRKSRMRDEIIWGLTVGVYIGLIAALLLLSSGRVLR